MNGKSREQCFECGRFETHRKGKVLKSDGIYARFRCNHCGNEFYNLDTKLEKSSTQKKIDEIHKPFKLTEDKVKALEKKKRFVVTSIQNDTPTFEAFRDSILNYCKLKDAELLIIPIRYINPSSYHRDVDATWDSSLEQYFVENNINLGKHIQILGELKTVATAHNPLSGLEKLTRGKTTILGHNQVQLKSCARLASCDPVVLTTTGTLSAKSYSDTKTGFIASQHHDNAALLIEVDHKNNLFHLRQLHADDSGGFYDIDGYYTPFAFAPIDYVEALITGDEHALLHNTDVMNATYLHKDSMLEKLKPKLVVRHDLLDSYSISHHDKDSFFKRYKKSISGLDDLAEELRVTLAHVMLTTVKGMKNIVVASNHNDHLLKWLDDPKSALDIKNAKIYTELRGLVLEFIDLGKTPLELWMQMNEAQFCEDFIKFLGRNESFEVCGIELSMHGDIGANGSRGSIASFAKTGKPCVVGHSHTPGIDKGCYQVGTSTDLQLEYNRGLSSWMNTHCVIYPNGTRSLLNIIKGRWFLDDTAET